MKLNAFLMSQTWFPLMHYVGVYLQCLFRQQNVICPVRTLASSYQTVRKGGKKKRALLVDLKTIFYSRAGLMRILAAFQLLPEK